MIAAGGAALVKLRVFAGLTLGQAAKALGIARRTADRDRAFARAWLFAQLRTGDEPGASRRRSSSRITAALPDSRQPLPNPNSEEDPHERPSI
jgi:hypothetical protein